MRVCGGFLGQVERELRERTEGGIHRYTYSDAMTRGAERVPCGRSPLEDHQPEWSVSTESHTAWIFSSGSLWPEMRSWSRMRFSSS